MDEIITSGKSNKRLLPLMIALVVVSAGLSGGLTYIFTQRNNSSSSSNTVNLPVSVQITQELANKQAVSALSLFNRQPASYRNSLIGQSTLSSIYMSSKNYPKALSVLNYIGGKWGWTYFLTVQASQISVGMKNYTQAINYDQQTIRLVQSEITTLTKAAKNINPNVKS